MASPSNSANNELPLHFDDKRTVDQLAHLTPQIHLTLTSVLQGGALVLLLTTIELPTLSPNSLAASLHAVIHGLATHDLYLTYVVSFMLIAIVWNEIAYAVFYLHWPLTALSTVYQFLLASTEIAMFSSANHLGSWLFWLGTVTCIGALIRRRNRNFVSEGLYPLKKAKEHSKRFMRRTYSPVGPWYFWALWLMLWPLGVTRWIHLFIYSPTLPLFGESFHPIDIGILIALGVVGLLIMRDDDSFFAKGIEEVLEDFDSIYQMRPNGSIQVRRVEPPPAPVTAASSAEPLATSSEEP